MFFTAAAMFLSSGSAQTKSLNETRVGVSLTSMLWSRTLRVTVEMYLHDSASDRAERGWDAA